MLQVVEMEGRVNEKGCIEVPAVVFGQTGISTGEAVKLLYMAEKEGDYRNPSREFLLSKGNQNPAEKPSGGQQMDLKIPAELLADAGIPEDADLDVVCMDGRIVLLPSEEMAALEIPQEILDICEELGIPKEEVSIVLRTDGGEATGKNERGDALEGQQI